MGWLSNIFSTSAEEYLSPSEDYAGQDVLGVNEEGCPYIGQSLETAIKPESLAKMAKDMGMTVNELKALLNS